MHPAQQDIAPLVAALLARQPLSPAKVSFAWPLAVGPALARRSRVEYRGDGVLHVIASDVHWRRELERAAASIVTRLEQWLGSGAVQRLVVRLE